MKIGYIDRNQCEKSAAGEEMNSDDFDREFSLEQAIKITMSENAELLERLGSDYDEDGIPYWEKWHKND